MDQGAILEEESRTRLFEESHARRFLYKDVEELIEHGFLTQEADFGDTSVVFRSLTPGEVRRCYIRGSKRGRNTPFLRWCLASSVWMVDGLEISMDPKDNGPWHIYKDWVEDLPNTHIDAYISFFIGLKNRVSRALRMIEAYCFEPYSRALWRLLGKPRWESGEANTVRRMWVAHNLSEDTAKLEDAQWQHTRMFVGSMSSKAAKELTRHMDKHENSEREYRKKAIEETVNWVIQGDEPEEEVELEIGGQTFKIKKIYSPTSIEDLEEEMRKVFAGESDYHDSMVEAQNQRVRDTVEARRAAQQEAMLAARQKLEERELAGEGASLVGYTKEQLEQINPDVTQRRGTDTYSDTSEARRLFDRYVNPKIVPGVLTPDLKVISPEKSDPRLPPENSTAEPPQSLQDKISSRKPTLGNRNG